MQIFLAILVALTIFEMMFSMGLKLSFSQIYTSVTSSSWLTSKVVIANFVFVPILTIMLVRMFNVDPYVATGLLILGVAPAAPYGPPFTAIAKGNLALSTGMMVFLAATSAFAVPLLLSLFIPWISDASLNIIYDWKKMMATLLMIQLIPLSLGLGFSEWLPRLAKKIEKPALLLSKVLNGLMITFIMFFQVKMVFTIELKELLLIVSVVLGGITIGWWMGGKNVIQRATLSITTGMRNMTLSMGLATASFPGTKAVTITLAYTFLAGFILLGYAYILRLFTISTEQG